MLLDLDNFKHEASSGDDQGVKRPVAAPFSEAVDARHSHLQEANELLQASAEQSHRKQTQFLSVLAHEY